MFLYDLPTVSPGMAKARRSKSQKGEAWIRIRWLSLDLGQARSSCYRSPTPTRIKRSGKIEIPKNERWKHQNVRTIHSYLSDFSCRNLTFYINFLISPEKKPTQYNFQSKRGSTKITKMIFGEIMWEKCRNYRIFKISCFFCDSPYACIVITPASLSVMFWLETRGKSIHSGSRNRVRDSRNLRKLDWFFNSVSCGQCDSGSMSCMYVFTRVVASSSPAPPKNNTSGSANWESCVFDEFAKIEEICLFFQKSNRKSDRIFQFPASLPSTGNLSIPSEDFRDTRNVALNMPLVVFFMTNFDSEVHTRARKHLEHQDRAIIDVKNKNKNLEVS